MEFLKIMPASIGLWVWLKPGAKKNAVLGFGDRGFEVAVTARAIEGAANSAMVALLAKYLDVPKNAIVLLKGQQSRHKYLEIKRLDGIIEKLHQKE